MARTTISLPDGLKAEMDKAADDANWSAIAADAFRSELNRIKARNAALKGKPMQAAIERLKASKQEYEQEAKERGHDAGVEWARDEADYGELKTLALNWEGVSSCETNDALGAPGVFLRLIGRDCDRSEINDFWDGLGLEDDSDKYSAEWWDGFVAGALKIFEEVDAKL